MSLGIFLENSTASGKAATPSFVIVALIIWVTVRLPTGALKVCPGLTAYSSKYPSFTVPWTFNKSPLFTLSFDATYNASDVFGLLSETLSCT